MMVELEQLAKTFGGRVVGASSDVRSVTLDSRRVEPGALFCALAGSQIDGRSFVDQALASGAAAVLTEDRGADAYALAPGSSLWLHSDARRISGLVADAVFGHPSRAMEVVGVTGTNGKTSTSFMVAELAAQALRKPSIFGTVEHRVWGQTPERATTTTLLAPETMPDT